MKKVIKSESGQSKHYVMIDLLDCIKKEKDIHHDSEIFILCYVDGNENAARYPSSHGYSVVEGGSIPFSRVVSFESELEIQLCESDYGHNTDDKWGKCKITENNLTGIFIYTNDAGDFDYRLHYFNYVPTFGEIDFNPSINSIESLFEKMSDDGKKVFFDLKCDHPYQGMYNHYQGIVSTRFICEGELGLRCANYISSSAKDSGYILISEENHRGALTNCLVINDYNHPGGMQIIGTYLVVACKGESDAILFYDIKDPFNPVLRDDLGISGDIGNCMAVGITKKDNRYILVQVVSSTVLNIYQSAEGSLNEVQNGPDLFWELIRQWNADDIENIKNWSPDQKWNDYQTAALLTQTDGTVYFVGFTNDRIDLFDLPEGSNLIELYKIDITESSDKMITKVASKAMKLKGGLYTVGVNFRYGAGLSFSYRYDIDRREFQDVGLYWQAVERKGGRVSSSPVKTNLGLIGKKSLYSIVEDRVLTDLYITTSSTERPFVPRNPEGYTLIGSWDVDNGSGRGTDGYWGGSYMAGLYAKFAPLEDFDQLKEYVSDVYLIASDDETPAKPSIEGYSLKGFWDVDTDGGAIGTDGSIGGYMAGLYQKNDKNGNSYIGDIRLVSLFDVEFLLAVGYDYIGKWTPDGPEGYDTGGNLIINNIAICIKKSFKS